jgi:hypothetical protein
LRSRGCLQDMWRCRKFCECKDRTLELRASLLFRVEKSGFSCLRSSCFCFHGKLSTVYEDTSSDQRAISRNEVKVKTGIGSRDGKADDLRIYDFDCEE